MIKLYQLTTKHDLIPAAGTRWSFLFWFAYIFTSEHIKVLLDKYVGTYGLDELGWVGSKQRNKESLPGLQTPPQ